MRCMHRWGWEDHKRSEFPLPTKLQLTPYTLHLPTSRAPESLVQLIVQRLEREVLGTQWDENQFRAGMNGSLTIYSEVVSCTEEVGTGFSCDQMEEMEFLKF